MKKHTFLAVCVLAVLTTFSGCWWEHDTCISTSDNDDDYEMNARFENHKTRRVHQLLRRHLDEYQHINFRSNEIDEDITLRDRTTFHIYSHPGEIEISFDKSENSEASCDRIRELCDEIKDILEDH